MPQDTWENKLDGMLPEPPRTATGAVDPGRFTLFEVQSTAYGTEVVLTSVVTARQVAAAAENRILWTDQNVQRGVRPEVEPEPAAMLAVGDGYPDPTKYIFDSDNADDIVEKLLTGQRLFLNPLVWNLRPGSFQAYLDRETRQFHLHAGRVFLPDSHHRHQAIVRAVQLYQEASQDYGAFSLDRQFAVELYFMTAEDEAEYFYEKNQLGRRADRSRAYQLTSQDAFALIAKRFAELTPSLKGNVNRVTDRLVARNPQVVTLSTLRTMAETVIGADEAPTSTEVERVATAMSRFYELLVAIRPELGVLSQEDRAAVRAELLVDQAVMMHGYAQLMRDFRTDIEANGEARVTWWERGLAGLAASSQVTVGNWTGDFLSRANPTWREVGVLQETKTGRTAVSNTRQTREVCGRLLRARINESGDS
jgi:hypothetical protein